MLQAGHGEHVSISPHVLTLNLQVGDSGVGKSCLLDKFLDDSSTNNFISTIGVDIRTREDVINDKKVKIQVWDTGGQQRYRPILASCYRGALGVIIVFDVTNKMSFKNISQWLVEVEEFAPDCQLPRILVSCGCSHLTLTPRLQVGNKADLVDRREVEYELAKEFAAINNIPYIETSVIGRSNINVSLGSATQQKANDNGCFSLQEAFLELVRKSIR